MAKLAFIVLAAAIIISALMVIILKNVVHSAFNLVITLFCVGCIFILLHSEFLAATQILIYVGAIMILIIFALILIDVKETDKERRFHYQSRWVIGIGAALAFEIVLFIIPKSIFTENSRIIAQAAKVEDTVQLLAHSLFNDFLFAFEFASMIILVAIVAAIFLAKEPLSFLRNKEV